MPAVIDRFAGQYRFLSNFYPSPFEMDGIAYATNEHFFNAMKTDDRAEREHIAAAPTAEEAKRRGRRCQLRANWDTTVRYAVMRLGLEHKFGNPDLARMLLETGEAELVEGTTWHDTHWGICLCSQHGGRGENHLGRMLMELRTQMRNHGGFGNVQ